MQRIGYESGNEHDPADPFGLCVLELRADGEAHLVEALREAVTNALMHRDHGPYARGTQVQVEMYSDQLVVRNPGGLFGTVTEDGLGSEGVSSSRNAVLARLLQDVTLPGTDQVVCENRGINPRATRERRPRPPFL